MVTVMHPFMSFMNVESSRSYIDNLYSNDPEQCLKSIVCIKNSVIGSNRQKEGVIAQGIVPRLLQLLEDRTMDKCVRLEAAVTIGSLAKGTDLHIELLISAGTISVLLRILEVSTNARLIDACLCCLRTLSQQDLLAHAYSVSQLEKLLSYATTSRVNSSDTTSDCDDDNEGEEEGGATTVLLLRQACVAAVISAACKGTVEQNRLCAVGAPKVLAALLKLPQTAVRIPVLRCIAAMCYENATVAATIAGTGYDATRNVPDVLVLMVTRDKPVEVQLEAAQCLTNIHRAGAISSYDPIITYRTLPCVVRICQSEHTDEQKASAANTLAYLTEVDSELQQLAAISNTLVIALADQLNSPFAGGRQAAFRAFASLGANDEDIRKRIIENASLQVMERVMEGLVDERESVRLAAVRCLTSLSRSVQQLRTTFQDHKVWRPLMDLLTGTPPTELLSTASSALCNLLLEFSPAKEPMIQRGVILLLAQLTTRPEPALRLNGVWALMNLAFQADQRVKSDILCALGTGQIFRLLADSDVRVLMKTLGLLRNLVSPRDHTDAVMRQHGPQVMKAVVLVLEGAHAPEVKEQALCILGNIADGAYAKEQIMENDDVLKKVRDYMTHSSSGLQHAAIFCISNLVRREEPGAAERQAKLRELNVLGILQQLHAAASEEGADEDHLYDNEAKAAISQFTDL